MASQKSTDTKPSVQIAFDRFTLAPELICIRKRFTDEAVGKPGFTQPTSLPRPLAAERSTWTHRQPDDVVNPAARPRAGFVVSGTEFGKPPYIRRYIGTTPKKKARGCRASLRALSC